MSDSKKTGQKILWASVAIAILAVGAWFWHKSGQPTEAVVETDEVTRGELRETVSATGALQALETIPVGTQVSGTIDKLYVDFNDKVKRGQLLATLDPGVLDSQLESARAALAQAVARSNDAVSALKEGEGLLAKAYISDRDMRTLKVNVVTLAAQVDSAKAEFSHAQRNRQYADIHSPIDGIVIERAVDRGQTVASGFQTPTLFTIAQDLKLMRILANVDESQIGSIKVGQNASFTVSAFPGKKFTALVNQIRLKPTTTQNVVTYSVVLDADNVSGELFPGMTATVDFVLKEFADVLRVPSAALRVQRVPEELMSAEALSRMKDFANGHGGSNAQGGASGRSGMSGVWVMNADGKASRVGVRLLASDMSLSAVEPVRGELKPGDRVITKAPRTQAQQSGNRTLLGAPPGPGNRSPH